MEIQIFKSKTDLNQAFTEWFKGVMKKKKFITVALSGGSTPKSLFDYWAGLPKDEIDWSKVKFFWGDERCVPPGDNESNFKMTREHLFNHITVPEENIFRIKGENNPAEEAHNYGDLLSEELEQTKGIPSFDIMMLGMGDDGHTASIFPYQINLWYNAQNCVEATHPETGQKRVSITGKVINVSENVVFLVTGKNKAEKIKEIIEYPEQSEKKYPAALVNPESGNLFWFIDEEAAELLTDKKD